MKNLTLIISALFFIMNTHAQNLQLQGEDKTMAAFKGMMFFDGGIALLVIESKNAC